MKRLAWTPRARTAHWITRVRVILARRSLAPRPMRFVRWHGTGLDALAVYSD